MKNVIVIGAGGHASVVIDIINSMIDKGEKLIIKGLLDDSEYKSEFMGYKILDKVENASLYSNEDTMFVIGIGNNQIRKMIDSKLDGIKYLTAIHSTAIIGSDVEIEEGTVVMPRSIINANTKIGRHVIINTGAIVEHDNKIEDFVHISPGAILAGGVTVGDSTQIGVNSTVIQCTTIGRNSLVGAGATVINDIQSNVIAVGTPARALKEL